MRRVAVGGALGALPGLLVVLVPLLLHSLGLISADQSQIGFIGLPLLVIGTLVGTVAAASRMGSAGSVWLGCGLGFLAGLGIGVIVTAGLSAVGIGLPAVWLFTMTAGMIIGAVLGARRSGHDRAA